MHVNLDGQRKSSNTYGERVLETVRQKGDPLATLIAEVRWQQLGMTRKGADRKAGEWEGFFTALEDPSRPHLHANYAKLTVFFEMQGIAKETVDRILDLLVADREGLDRFFERLHYKFGPELLAASGLPREKLTVRREKGTVPDYLEPQEIVRTLFSSSAVRERYRGREKEMRGEQRQLLDDAKTFWTLDKQKELHSRGIEDVLVRFLTEYEKYVRSQGKPFSNREAFEKQVPTETAFALSRCTMTPWCPELEALVRKVIPAAELEAFRTQWFVEQVKETPRSHFKEHFMKSMEAQGITTAQLAAFAGIDRSTTNNPTQAVRQIIDQCRASEVAPPLVLVELVGRDNVQIDEQGTFEKVALIRSFRRDREDYYRRTGNAVHGGRNAPQLSVRIGRDLAGVSAHDLAWQLCDPTGDRRRALEAKRSQKVPADVERIHKRLLRFELGEIPQQGARNTSPTALAQRMEPPMNREEQMSIFRAIQTLGEAKVAAALERKEQAEVQKATMPDTLGTVDSIPAYIAALVQSAGGMKPAARITRGSTRSTTGSSLGMHAQRLRNTINGNDIPPLPLLVQAVKNVQAKMGWQCDADALEAQLRRTWYVDYPEHLLSREKDPVEDPLARMLCTIIAGNAPTNTAFARKMPVAHGYAVPLLSATVGGLKVGWKPSWHNLSMILRAGKFREGTPVWKLAEQLFEDPDTDLSTALKTLLPTFREEGIEIHPSTLPGITLEELGVKKKTQR
ncbi:MAG: hypothetical protein Q7R81_05915 [Candidatus Peregrinibacteria bacterium]|nr:hypothetical protein [Candidatus Peregrinibacteria bacterium]